MAEDCVYSRGSLCVQLSISHFPLFISMLLCLGSICSSIDLPIDHCPPLISTLVACGGALQLIAHKENLFFFFFFIIYRQWICIFTD